jgi:hypothetical protein
MGLVAMLAALGIGFVSKIGRASRALQGASILAEAGFECRNRSVGGRRATLVVAKEADADGNERVVLSQAVQRPILTAHFEEAQWFVNAGGPATARPEGTVALDPDGKSGSAVAIGQGGRLDFGTQAVFAPTDGIEVSCWVKPAPGRGAMILLQGADAYEVWLVKEGARLGSSDAYAVRLRLKLVDAGDSARSRGATAMWTPFTTVTAPVLAGQWSELLLSFDGARASLRVDGIEHKIAEAEAGTRRRPPGPPAPGGAAAPGGPSGAPSPETPWRRFPTPEGGGVHLTLASTQGYAFVGSVDTLFVQGIFRTDADRRLLASGLDVERPKLPLVVRFENGRLDPDFHRGDATLLLLDEADPEGERYLVRYGLYGLVSAPRLLLAGEDPDGLRTPKTGTGP